jgi:hypothetical protein
LGGLLLGSPMQRADAPCGRSALVGKRCGRCGRWNEKSRLRGRLQVLVVGATAPPRRAAGQACLGGGHRIPLPRDAPSGEAERALDQSSALEGLPGRNRVKRWLAGRIPPKGTHLGRGPPPSRGATSLCCFVQCVQAPWVRVTYFFLRQPHSAGLRQPRQPRQRMDSARTAQTARRVRQPRQPSVQGVRGICAHTGWRGHPLPGRGSAFPI